jgi:RNA polymerase sigma factor (sigma-70 family)
LTWSAGKEGSGICWRGGRKRPQVVVSAEDQVLAGIEHGHLGQALADLPPELRAALEATVLDGLTCAEAAVLLGVAEGTVKSRCHRARQALRAALAEPQARQRGQSHRQEAWGTP